MENIMAFKQSGLNLPMSQAFITILKRVVSLPSKIEVNHHAVILNFRDPQYTAENGDFIRWRSVSYDVMMAGNLIISPISVLWVQYGLNWKKKWISVGVRSMSGII